jgi:hypothetical protein
VVVHGRGAPRSFFLDQSVIGGFFAPLGKVTLLQNEPVVVVVDNGTGESAAGIYVGIDAFRFDLLGDGLVADGETCQSTWECAGDLICTAGTCTAGCETAGCPSGACVISTGLCDESGIVPDAGIAQPDGGPADGADAGASGDGGIIEDRVDAGLDSDPGDEEDEDLPPALVGGCACGATLPSSLPGWALFSLCIWGLRWRRQASG